MADIRTNGNAADLQEFVPAHSERRQYAHYWNTPEAFAAHCESVDKNKAWYTSGWSEENREGGFHGTRDLPTAINLCRDGWKEGAERATALRDRINAENPTGPRIVKYDVAGAYPSVPRALAGNPLNMRRVDNARLRRRPVLTLISDAAVDCNVDSKSQERRAAVIAAVVDAIESAQFACQVVTVSTVKDQPREGTKKLAVTIATQVKESSQPLDIARVAFALGHPAYLRRLCFVAYCEDSFTSDLSTCIGYPCPAIVDEDMNARQVYLLPSCDKKAEQHFRSDDAAATHGLEFIIDALRKQGCPAFPQEEPAAA